MKTAVQKSYKLFNQSLKYPEGWYWLIEYKALSRNKPVFVKFANQEFVVFKTENGQVVCLDAYCPHMGANLKDGKVIGNNIQCVFHHWQFDTTGQCVDIPCINHRSGDQSLDKHTTQPSELMKDIKINSWPVEIKYGLVWIWIGKSKPNCGVPNFSDLTDNEFSIKFGPNLKKTCHPNTLMVNAIDEQHFNYLHSLNSASLGLNIEVVGETEHSIDFVNQLSPPKINLVYKFISLFYKDKWTYKLSYWFGHTGLVQFGPDFLNFYIIFTTRQNQKGEAEGKTIYLNKKRGFILDEIVFFLTHLGDLFFGQADDIIFKNAKFQLKNPIKADKSILNYIVNLERQKVYEPK